MHSEVLIALFSLLGTLAGTFGGIMKANQMTNYRIEQLEKKQDKYNNIIARTYKLEGQVEENSHDIKEIKSCLKTYNSKGC